MTADPRDSVSEITEIQDTVWSEGLLPFCKAAWWGSLAASGLFLLLSVPVGLAAAFFDGDTAGIYIAFLPLLISGAGTLGGMILVGLPVTGLLHSLGRERLGTYVRTGVATGFVLPGLFLLISEGADPMVLPAGLFFGLFGMIAGGVAALKWGEYRQTRAARSSVSETRANPPTNPFHDMIH